MTIYYYVKHRRYPLELFGWMKGCCVEREKGNEKLFFWGTAAVPDRRNPMQLPEVVLAHLPIFIDSHYCSARLGVENEKLVSAEFYNRSDFTGAPT